MNGKVTEFFKEDSSQNKSVEGPNIESENVHKLRIKSIEVFYPESEKVHKLTTKSVRIPHQQNLKENLLKDSLRNAKGKMGNFHSKILPTPVNQDLSPDQIRDLTESAIYNQLDTVTSLKDYEEMF